jgi:hypothetical protein
MARRKKTHIVKVHPDRLRKHTPKKAPTRPSQVGRQIAPGFTARPALDLRRFSGKITPALSYLNVYLGSARWQASDQQNIDVALSGAMSDPGLNNVLRQYFDGAIGANFLGRKTSDVAVPATFTRDDVSATLDALLDARQLGGIDLSTTVICLLLPPGVILDTTAAGGVGHEDGGGKLGDKDDKDSSLDGLGGYHGSHQAPDGSTIYFAAAVFSEIANGRRNGIPVFEESWKNVVATLYHELTEARTDPDVEEVNRTGQEALLGWYSQEGGEIGDIPINEAVDDLHKVFVEVALQAGGTAPIQLMWSNAVHGPEGPFTTGS